MATINFAKDADEILDYVLDWSSRLQTDTISTSTWLMPVAESGGIVKDSESNSTTTTTIWLSGGTENKSYSLVNRIVTNGGRTMDQTCIIKIKAR